MTRSCQTHDTDAAPPAPATTHDLGETDETLERLTAWFAEYGDTFRVYSPARRSWTWVLSDPDDVRRVLVANHRNYTKGVGIDRVRLLLGDGLMTSEGEPWRRQRRMMQPSFHRRVVERLTHVVREENRRLYDDWAAAAAAGGRINVTGSMRRLSLRIVLRAIFGDDLPELLRAGAAQCLSTMALEPRRDPRFAYEFRQLAHHVLDLLRRRLAREATRVDFLQFLLDARDPSTGEPMRERQLLDEVLTLVVAGHETTASALDAAWRLLATRPSVEDALVDEQRTAGDLGLARHADLDRLPRTRRVIDEVLRLHPPGWLLTRRSIGPDRLLGYRLPPATDVFICPYLLHRHPRHWTDPGRFDPDRFEAPAVEARHAFAYIPFGAGPRLCIGQAFALYEMMLHLNGALPRFRLRDPDPPQPALEARINLRTAADVHMGIEIR